MGASVKLKSVDEYLYGYVFIELFHLANKYKIFQYLIDYKGESIEKMAEALTLNNDALERILINLSAADILHHHQGIFCINPDYVHFFDQHDDGYIGHFIHFIRNQGRAALQKLEGRLTNETHSQSPYDTLYDTPNDTTDFTQAMWQLSYSTAKGLAQYLPNPLGKIVDIGGGSGAMACAFVQAGISEQLSVFDLAAVREDFDRQMAAHQLTGRINFIDGDFFTDPLPQADSYFLSYVLSNWDESQIVSLLQKIAAQLPADGQLIVFERLFAEDGVNPLPTAMMHLNMMLHTQGSHRTIEGYRQLFITAGFDRLDVIHTPYDKQLLIATKSQL